MENGQYNEKISKYAVRIALNNHKELKGSGVLFLRQSGESPLLFTAAHVLYPIFQNSNNTLLYLGCSDCDGNPHEIEINVHWVKEKSQAIAQVGETYIHPRYEEKETEKNGKKEYNYDVAIVVLRWEEWMRSLDYYELKGEKVGNDLNGWGFPEAADSETKKEHATILSGKKEICGKIENTEKETGKFSVYYNAGTWERNVTRESYMSCFSGCGLFHYENNRMLLNGLISCEFGDRSVGTMFWASSSNLLLGLMDYFGVEQNYPLSFEYYKEMTMKEIPEIRKEARRFFCDWYEELTEDYHLLPENFSDDTRIGLLCESTRKFCDNFWVGQLKKCILLYGIQKIKPDELTAPFVKILNPCGVDNVRLVFLCTEEKAESVIGSLIEKEYFTKSGDIKNGTIFVLNGKENNRNCNIVFKRFECRQVVCSIIDGYSSISTRKIQHKTYNLCQENEEEDFDIIRGKLAKCNLAALGIDNMMSVLNQGRVDKKCMKKEMEGLLEKVWEI